VFLAKAIVVDMERTITEHLSPEAEVELSVLAETHLATTKAEMAELELLSLVLGVGQLKPDSM
jgi:hypothetical protein